MSTIIDTLADFSANTTFEQLPAAVVEESKRILLDSIGCALGGLSHPKGTIGVQGPAHRAPKRQSSAPARRCPPSAPALPMASL